MTKIEEIRATGTQGFTPLRRVAASNVIPFTVRGSVARPAAPAELETRRFALGRKGRRAQVRRRVLDGLFIAAAMGTAALLWWTTT